MMMTRIKLLSGLLVIFAALSVDVAQGLDLDEYQIENETPYAENLYSKGGNPKDNSGVTLQVGNGTVTMGGTANSDSTGFSMTVGKIESTSANAKLVIASAAKSGADGRGVNITADILNLDTAGTAFDITIDGATSSAASRLTVNNLQSSNEGNSTITVGQYGTLDIKTVQNGGKLGASNGKFDLNLNGGKASLTSGSSVTLVQGTIKGHGELAVGSGLTLAGAGATDSVLHVTDELNIVSSLGGAADGRLTVGNGTGMGKLILEDVLNVGTLTFNAGAVVDASGDAAINANSLNVKESIDTSGAKTTVAGLTTVDKGKTYTVDGTDNSYAGGMDLYGTFANNGLTKVTFGTGENRLANLNVLGGQIQSTGNTFTIDYANVVITTETGYETIALDATAGKLDLGTSDVTVRLDPGEAVEFNTTRNIDMNNYRQLQGTVTLTGTGGVMSVNKKAYIGNSAAGTNVDFEIGGNTAAFKGGVQLDPSGALVSVHDNATVSLGNGSVAGDLTMTSNSALLGTGNKLSIIGQGRINVTEKGNIAHGEIDAGAIDAVVQGGGILNVASKKANGLSVDSMTVYGTLNLGTDHYNRANGIDVAAGLLDVADDLIVKNGGKVDANFRDAAIGSNNPGNNRIFVERGGQLSATTANIYANGFKSVDISGNFTAGWDSAAGDSAKLISTSDVSISSTGTISLTAELARNAVAGTELIQTTTPGAIITNRGNTGYKSMYGILEYAINADKDVLYIKEVRNQIDPNASEEEQRQQALDNLRDMWGEKQIKYCFGNLVFDVLEGNVVADPTDSVPGQKNIGLLTAIGNPDSLNVSSNTLEYLNGAHLVGVTDVAIETSRTFMSDITNRAKAVNCQFVAAREASSSDALASTAMNSMAYNRIWVGGTGFWQSQDGRQGFSGYSYDATGLTLGFDKIITPNLAMGISGAYLEGNYEDSGALKHDSKIESFSTGLYGTYSANGGWYATLFGAYTYSDNSLKELRNDPTTDDRSNSWATSDFRTDTWSFGANAGYDIRIGECLTITPSVGINYIQARNSDHQSFLGGVGTQQIKDARNRGIFVPLELTAQYDRGLANGATLRMEAIAGYAYNLRSTGLTGSISYYDLTGNPSCGIASPDNVRHSYRGGLGFRYLYENYDIGARYDYIGKSGYTAHRLSANVGFSF